MLEEFDELNLQSLENKELTALYTKSKNIYDMTCMLIDMLDEGERFESFDAISELFGLIYITHESKSKHALRELPQINKISIYSQPALWDFFFVNTLEFMAQQMGETLSLDDEIVLPFSQQEFLEQARAWSALRLEKMMVLNSGSEGLEDLTQFLFEGILNTTIANATLTDTPVDETTKESLEQYWTLQVTEIIEALKTRLVHMPMHRHQAQEYPQYYELIKFYPVHIAYLFVNESGKTNLDLAMTVGLLQACKQGGVIVLGQFHNNEAFVNETELLGYLIHDSEMSIRWYQDAYTFYEECIENTEEPDEQGESDYDI